MGDDAIVASVVVGLIQAPISSGRIGKHSDWIRLCRSGDDRERTDAAGDSAEIIGGNAEECAAGIGQLGVRKSVAGGGCTRNRRAIPKPQIFRRESTKATGFHSET